MRLRMIVTLMLVSTRFVCSQSIGGAISGSVEDAHGLPVEAVRIEITNERTAARTTVFSNSLGHWRIAVPAGEYEVEVTREGFTPVRFRHISLTVGEGRSLRAVLLPAARAEQVTVSASTLAVQQDSADRTSSYDQTLMSDLPMVAGGAGRNFRTQVYVTPGVVPSTAAHRPFAVNGARNRNNNYLIDSNDFNEIEGGLLMGRGASEQLLSTEAIAGMQVLTHNFKAEYGRQNGSVISIVTKSGSNEWHGLAYEYLRNDKLDARNTFDLARPPLRYNQFGFNLGGPVRKDRTFFFANTEWFIRRQTSATTIRTVPESLRTQASQATAPLVALYPLPNLPGTNLYRANVPTSGDQRSNVFRVDHEISPSQRLMFRSTVLDSTNRGVAGAAQQRYETQVVPQGHSLQYTLSPGSTFVNEARLNYTRFTINDRFIDPVALGDPAVNGLVGTVNVGGLSQLGQFSFMARQTAQNNYQATDDVSWVRGVHSFKAGVALRRLHLNNGTFAPSFTGILRFNSVADLVAGKAASYARNIGNPYLGLRATEVNGYIQDDWRITRRLTINAGLRYEYNSVPAEVNGLVSDQYRYRPDYNNFAPRFGFAWLADGTGTTVIRGGYGIYYNVLELSFVGLTRFNPPLIANYNTANPVFPDLLAGAQQALPSGLVVPDPGLRQPYAQHLNFTVERQLFNPQTSLTLAYVGTLARKLPRVTRPNGGDGLAQALRPDPSVGVVNRLETAANSSYHGLQASFNGQLRGFRIRASYTWSKFLDEVSDFPSTNTGIDRELLALDEQNWRLNRGPSDFDIRHVLTFAYSWELPWLRRNRILGGWSVQGITTVQSGRPFTLFSGTDSPDGNNSNRVLNVPGSIIRNGSGPSAVALAPGVTTASLTPAPGELGRIGRNTERGDSLLSWNISMFKNIPLTERLRLQFRAEAFNIANTVNYDRPEGVLTSTVFGQATSAFDPRQVQLALRFSF